MILTPPPAKPSEKEKKPDPKVTIEFVTSKGD